MKQTISGSTLRTPTLRARTCSAARRCSRARLGVLPQTLGQIEFRTPPTAPGPVPPDRAADDRQGAPRVRLGGAQGGQRVHPAEIVRHRAVEGGHNRRRRHPERHSGSQAGGQELQRLRRLQQQPFASTTGPEGLQPAQRNREDGRDDGRGEPAEDGRAQGQARGQQTERQRRRSSRSTAGGPSRGASGRPRTRRTSRGTLPARWIRGVGRAKRWPSHQPYAASAVKTAQARPIGPSAATSAVRLDISSPPIAPRAGPAPRSTARPGRPAARRRADSPSPPVGSSSQLIGSPPSR